MSVGKDNLRYYMPLNSGGPQDGPTTSVFSVPRVQYSPQTEAVVKNLMRESRLTFTQKHVFDTILRNGRSLPENPSQIMKVNRDLRQSYMQNRHKHKARSMGIPLLEEDLWHYKTNPNFMHSGPSRRSFEVIKASGVLEPTPPPKAFYPKNKDAEKDRLIHKMAFGKEMKNSPFSYHLPPEAEKNGGRQKKSQGKSAKSETETIADLKNKRIEELLDEIQDRMQFLLTMEQAKKVKEYKTCIINQIHEKLHEMKAISPEKEKDVRESLQLDLLERHLGYSAPIEHRSSKFFMGE